MKNKLVSIVISAYNEEDNVAKLYQELLGAISGLKNVDFEFRFHMLHQIWRG